MTHTKDHLVAELVAALEQAAMELEEASKLLHAANIGGSVLHGTAMLYTVAAEKARAAIAKAEGRS